MTEKGFWEEGGRIWFQRKEEGDQRKEERFFEERGRRKVNRGRIFR